MFSSVSFQIGSSPSTNMIGSISPVSCPLSSVCGAASQLFYCISTVDSLSQSCSTKLQPTLTRTVLFGLMTPTFCSEVFIPPACTTVALTRLVILGPIQVTPDNTNLVTFSVGESTIPVFLDTSCTAVPFS